MNIHNFTVPNSILTLILSALNFSQDGDEIGGGESITLGYNGDELYVYIKRHSGDVLNINIRGN